MATTPYPPPHPPRQAHGRDKRRERPHVVTPKAGTKPGARSSVAERFAKPNLARHSLRGTP